MRNVHDTPELPTIYGKPRLVALMRNPYSIFCYWEAEERDLARLGSDHAVIRLVDSLTAAVIRELKAAVPVGNCNFALPGPGTFHTELGTKSASGLDILLVSNEIETKSNASVRPSELQPVQATSPGYIVPVGAAQKLELNAEIVFSGKAPAGSVVTVNGQEIKPELDGKFQIRLALPEGELALPIEVRNGSEVICATPLITKQTVD